MLCQCTERGYKFTEAVQEFSFLLVVSGPLLTACRSKYRSFMYETQTGLCGLSHKNCFNYANEY